MPNSELVRRRFREETISGIGYRMVLVAIGVLIMPMSEQSADFCSGAIFMATSYEMSLNRLSLHSAESFNAY